MKIRTTFSITVLTLLTIGCSNETPVETEKIPVPGTIIAEMSEPVTDDTLNSFVYTIRVIADSNVKSGVYDIEAEYGPNFATSKLTMPGSKGSLIPVIRKGPEPYSHIIGFRLPDDTTFNEYYLVVSSKSSTKMRYLKSYTFE